jgi:hypothetical protein
MLKLDSNLVKCGALEQNEGTQMQHRLEPRYVFCLKAFGAFLYFKFHCLAFVERFVSVHHDRGEMHENIFPGLTLDKTIALRSIEPLDCSLFLHFHYLELGLPVLVRWLAIASKAPVFKAS